MINASKKFRDGLLSGASVVNYADVTMADGTVLHLEPKDIMLGGCSVDDKTTDGKFGVGYVIGKTLTLKVANYSEQLSEYDFYSSSIVLYVAMQMDDGTVEKIRKGIYYTTVPETPGDIIEISAVDGMYKLDRDYASSTTVYPATLQAIITDACLDCGIPIGFTHFGNMDYIVGEKPAKATYRQIVSWACQIAGYNARIDNDGYMQLVWYQTAELDELWYDGGNLKAYPHDTVVDGGDFSDYGMGDVLSGGDFVGMTEHVFRLKSLDVHTDDVRITGVRVTYGDKENVLSGEEGYVITVKENPFTAGHAEEVANYLGGRMIALAFRPFSAEIPNNPLYEPYEVIRITDRKGNIYHSIINSVQYKIGGYTRIACKAEDPIRKGSTYMSASAQAVVDARRNAEKQITEYDKAVQNMNQIAANAMGYHTTYEDTPDGGRITYLHDKPSLADSMTIYKQTADGFFLSTDGGESYTSGFDSNGNATLNLLYAIGIVADWIKTGKFECKKDGKTTFLADVDTGEVRIVADAFSLSDGKTIQSIAKDAVGAQTQSDIFNKLTNNGSSSGIYLQNGNLYVNASYIKSGTLVLGGTNNANGILSIRDANNAEIGRWDNNGITAKGSFYSDNGSFATWLVNGHIMGGTSDSVNAGYISFNQIWSSTGEYGIRVAGAGFVSFLSSRIGVGEWTTGNSTISLGKSGSVTVVTNVYYNSSGTLIKNTKTLTFTKGLMTTEL